MATQAGFKGSASYAGANVNFAQLVYQWTLNYEAGEGETTEWDHLVTELAAGRTPSKTFISLTTEWSGSFMCRLDSATAIPDPGTTITELELRILSTTFGYEGEAFVTTANPSLDANGVPELTVNYRGTGPLTVGAI